MIALSVVLWMTIGQGAAESEKPPVSRPAWAIRSEPVHLPLHTELVVGEVWATRDEARQDVLDRAAIRARQLVTEVTPRVSSSWQVPSWLVSDHLLRENIYIEEVDWTYGPMYRGYLLLDSSPAKRDLLVQRWRDVYVREQLGHVGGGFAFVMVCLATVLGYLRLDDATRGYYSGWLLAGSGLLVATSGAALYTWIF